MKKQYIFPNTVVVALHVGPMLNNASPVKVNPNAEGEQTEAEGRSYRHRSVWDDEEEEW